MKQIFSIILFAALTFVPLSSAVAQTSYWCGSYYSATPCGYNNQYYPNQYYQPYQYNYQYQYGYPYYNNYQYYYPYGNYGYSYQVPTCTITYSGNGTGYYGSYQPLTLSWTSQNATSGYLTNVGSVQPSGSATVYPSGMMTYTLTVTGAGGSNTCSATYMPSYYPYGQYQQYNYSYPYNYYPYYY